MWYLFSIKTASDKKSVCIKFSKKKINIYEAHMFFMHNKKIL